jgi:uncharacterized membrane protein
MQTFRQAIAGLLGGLALGTLARFWMRLLSDDPEFSWSGTLFIIGGFGVFGLLQTVPRAVRRRRDAGWKVGVSRVVGGVGMLPLFVAAGAVMLPTVLAGGMATTRPNWRRFWIGVAWVVAALPIVVIVVQSVDESGWTLGLGVAVVLIVCTYALVVRWARPTLAPQRYAHRGTRWVAVGAGGALALASVMLTVGFSTGG